MSLSSLLRTQYHLLLIPFSISSRAAAQGSFLHTVILLHATFFNNLIYPWSFLHSAWLPDLSLPPRPLLSFTPSFLLVWQAGSPTLFITPCPEPTLLTFHPGMPSHVFSVIVNLFISPDKSSWESMVFFPSNWLLFLNFVYNPA